MILLFYHVHVIRIYLEKLKSDDNQTWVNDRLCIPSYVNEVKSHMELFLCKLLYTGVQVTFYVNWIYLVKLKSDDNQLGCNKGSFIFNESENGRKFNMHCRHELYHLIWNDSEATYFWELFNCFRILVIQPACNLFGWSLNNFVLFCFVFLHWLE